MSHGIAPSRPRVWYAKLAVSLPHQQGRQVNIVRNRMIVRLTLLVSKQVHQHSATAHSSFSSCHRRQTERTSSKLSVVNVMYSQRSR